VWRRYSSGVWSVGLRLEVTCAYRSIWRWENATEVTISLEDDSISNHCKSIDGVVVSRRCRDQLDELCEIIPQHKVIRGWHSRTEDEEYFTRNILEWAADNQLSTVGTIAYGQGEHEGILTVLNSWAKTYPQHVRIFFFDEEDFQDIRSNFEYTGA